jgi:arabinose-5-phosphate isomerase
MKPDAPLDARARGKDDVAAHEIDRAKQIFDEDIAGLRAVRERIGAELVAAVEAIESCRGRLIVSGVGKSGLIAKKIASTLTSTGTPSLYLHPVEAAHGDLGLVHAADVVVIISKSGMSDELRSFIPALRQLGVTIIGMTGSRDSYLGKHSDIVLDTHVPRESGSLGLAPTTSTTVALVMGHALASALMERKGFTAEDFARVHPSGILGKRLTLTVRELMRTGDDVPLVPEETSLKDALFEIMEKSIGCTGVVDSDGFLVGIITDGDLKRILASRPDALTTPVRDVMTRDPRTIRPDVLAADALSAMELNEPGPLLMYFIVDDAGRPTGLLHIHDILRAGLSAE